MKGYHKERRSVNLVLQGLSSKLNLRVFHTIPAHSSGTGQMFLEDKIHGFKYTYISDENVVQQTK